MNTTELRASFKHIHSYQDWQRQCEQLADEIDRLRGALKGAEIALGRDEDVHGAMRCILAAQ